MPKHTGRDYYEEIGFIESWEYPLFPKKPLWKRIAYCFAYVRVYVDFGKPKDANGRYQGKEYIDWRKTALINSIIVGFIVLGYFWIR